MKNLVKKFGILALLLSLNLSIAADIVYADGILKPLSDVKDCVEPSITNADETKKAGPDDGYIITILEEPLESGAKRGEDYANADKTYIERICFRNTFQYLSSTGEIISENKLGKRCSEVATGLANNGAPKTDKEPAVDKKNIRFGCKEVLVILSKGGTTMIYGYIGMIYRWSARLVGLVAVLVIVVSGIQLAASGGDPEAINAAKGRIIKSFSGIAILFLSGIILNTVNPNFYIF